MRTVTTGLALAAALTLALPSIGQAAARRKHNRTPDAVKTPATDNSDGGTWGVGAAYLPSPTGALNALSGTYLIMPDLKIDGMLLGGNSSVPLGGTNSSGAQVNDGTGSFGIGAQARYSLLHPTSFLAFQLVGRLSYVVGTDSHEVLGTTVNSSASEFGLFVGAGFEGFIPAWKVVSIEVNSGMNIALTDSTSGGSSAGGAGVWLGASNANAFVPLNLAVHYYF